MAANDYPLGFAPPLLQTQPFQPAAPALANAAPPQPLPQNNPAIRAAALLPANVAPPPMTANSLSAQFAALAPFVNGTPPPAAAPSVDTPVAPAIPPVNSQGVVAPAVAAAPSVSSAAAPRAPRPRAATAAAPAVPADPYYVPGFAPGTPNLAMVPNSVTYDDQGRVAGQRGADGNAVGGGPLGVDLASLPGGGRQNKAGQFVDPRDSIALGYAMQLAYQKQSIANLLGAFGASDGLAATKHALAQTIGANNFAQVQGQGTNTINSALGGIAQAGIGAGSAANVANIHEAGLNARSEATLGQQNEQFMETPRAVGTEPSTVDIGGTRLPGPALTTYATPRQGMVGPAAQRASAAKPQVGKTYVDKAGNRATYNADGTYTPVK